MHRFVYLSGVLLTGACIMVEGPKEVSSASGSSGGEASDSASETGSPTEASAEGGATEVESASGATEGEATEAATSGSTGEVVPAACVERDPGVSAAFGLALVDWPDATDAQHEIDVVCMVDAVEPGPTNVTRLTCDVGEAKLAAVLSFAAPVLAEDYLAGEQVRLVSRAVDADEIGIGVLQHLVMRSAADDRLLVVGVRNDALAAEWFAPVAVDVSFPCGPERGFDAFDPVPLQIDFAIPEGPALGLISGQRGLLDGGEGFAFDIDVEYATTDNCCHYLRFHEVLLRRVVVDG